MSKQCIVKPLKQESSPLKQESYKGTTATDTDTIWATQHPKIIPGLKDLAVGSDWKACLELVKMRLGGFRSDEYQQLQFAIEYKEVLSKAAEKGFIDFIKLLLRNGFPVNTVVNSCRRTMLHVAIINNKIDLIKTLLSYGADIDLTDSQGFSAIHLVAIYGFYDIVKLLLQRSDESSIPYKNVDARDKRGNSPLHYAAEYGHANIVCHLIEIGANINARTKERETPLILAAKNGHTEVVKTLLSNAYCDVDAIDTSLCTALKWAKDYRFQPVVELLTSKK